MLPDKVKYFPKSAKMKNISHSILNFNNLNANKYEADTINFKNFRPKLPIFYILKEIIII